MPIQAVIRVVLVPTFILLCTALYWVSIQEAAGAARRVPTFVMIFVVVMTLIVVVTELIKIQQDGSNGEVTNAGAWLRLHSQRILFVAICFAYYPLFISLGFNIANFLFLSCALTIAGLGKGRKALSRLILVLTTSLVATVVFHLLAQVMDFNVPTSPFGF